MRAIKKAVEIIGGQTALAVQLSTDKYKVRQNSVFGWVNTHKQAPAKYIKKISVLTENKVTIEELLEDHEKNHHEKTTETGI